MKRWGSPVLALAAATTLGAAEPRLAWAQDAEAELGWSDTAELTVVFTGGNAEASTLGFRNELARTWDEATLLTTVRALRAESTTFTRTAVGVSPASFEVTKESVTALTAESYYARGQYDRQLRGRTFWYAGTGWERNTFAGIANRYSWVGGVGNTWIDNDRSTFRTNYGVSYTLQDDVTDASGADDTFAGLRLSYDYRQQLTPNTEFTSVLAADENLEDRADFRSDLINALAISMNSRLAVKVSWQLLYDRQPSLVSLPLIHPTGAPTASTVLVELDSVDNFVTFALVANF